MVAERVHAPRLVARAADTGAERRGDEDRHRDQRRREHDERRPVERGRRGEGQAERARPALDGDAVVAVRDAEPPIGDTPHDLAERHRDHHEAEPGAAKGQRREDDAGDERHHERARHDRQVAVAIVQQARAGVRGDAEQSRVPERHQPRVTDQHVDAEREDRVEQDLARDVHVVGAAHPERHRRQDGERDGQREPLHAVGRPNRPWGRNTRTISIGRKSTT